MAKHPQVWFFDQPLNRDPLFLVALMLGLANTAADAVWGHHHGVGDFILETAFKLPLVFFYVGLTAGLVRNRLRARTLRRAE